MTNSNATSKIDTDLNRTSHMESRMNQRGVSQQLVDLTLALGVPRHNGRVELSIRLIEWHLQELDYSLNAVCSNQLKSKLKAQSVSPIMGSELRLPEFMVDRIDVKWRVPDSAEMIYLDGGRHKVLVKTLMEWRSSLIKARDKKGIVVVVEEDTLLTTYANPENLGWNR